MEENPGSLIDFAEREGYNLSTKRAVIEYTKALIRFRDRNGITGNRSAEDISPNGDEMETAEQTLAETADV